MREGDWRDEHASALGMRLCGSGLTDLYADGEPLRD